MSGILYTAVLAEVLDLLDLLNRPDQPKLWRGFIVAIGLLSSPESMVFAQVIGETNSKGIFATISLNPRGTTWFLKSKQPADFTFATNTYSFSDICLYQQNGKWFGNGITHTTIPVTLVDAKAELNNRFFNLSDLRRMGLSVQDIAFYTHLATASNCELPTPLQSKIGQFNALKKVAFSSESGVPRWKSRAILKGTLPSPMFEGEIAFTNLEPAGTWQPGFGFAPPFPRGCAQDHKRNLKLPKLTDDQLTLFRNGEGAVFNNKTTKFVNSENLQFSTAVRLEIVDDPKAVAITACSPIALHANSIKDRWVTPVLKEPVSLGVMYFYKPE